MKIEKCKVFCDVLIIKKKIFKDERGFFTENFRQDEFDRNFFFAPMNFVQDNVSYNPEIYTLRGLHFQYPRWQGKYVTVVNGEVNVVIVDLREGSDTFGVWNRYELDIEKSLYVPEGFAHGFLTMTPNTYYFYKNTRYYCQKDCNILYWNDSDLNINWGIGNGILDNCATISNADQQGNSFEGIKEVLCQEQRSHL